MPEANDVSVIIPVRCAPKPEDRCAAAWKQGSNASCTTGKQELRQGPAQLDTSTLILRLILRRCHRCTTKSGALQQRCALCSPSGPP